VLGAEESRKGGAMDGTTILVAEDNAFIRTLVKAALGPLGCEIVEAVDGEDALSAVSQHNPDIILLDVVMPKLNGFDVLEILRGDKYGLTCPIVMLTTSASQADMEHGARSGATAYLVKPFDKDELRDTVASLL